MDFYLLDANFQRQSVVENVPEILWTDRYSGVGDVSVKVLDTPANRTKYPLGRFLARDNSSEIMMIDRRQSKSGFMTLTGKSLLDLLRRRQHSNLEEATATLIASYEETGNAQLLAKKIFDLAIVDGTATGNPDAESYFWIPNLDLGPELAGPSYGGVSSTISINGGQNYLEPLLTLADEANMGVKIHLNSATPPSTYQLYATAYFGDDLSDSIVFSEANGDFTDVESIESIENVAGNVFVYVPAWVGLVDGPYTAIYYRSIDAAGVNNTDVIDDAIGFQNTSVIVPMSELTEDDYFGDNAGDAVKMILRGRKELTAYRKLVLADGELSAAAASRYGTDYFLGDLVTVEATNGISSKARISEFIVSRDETGERSYPTLELIDD